IMVLAFAANGIYPFGEDQIAVIDMYHQYVPFLAELQYKLQEGGNLFYTWNGAGGSNFWNLMAYYGASPLNLLLALFPKKLIMEGVTFVLIIKVGLAGSFMALYLRYISRRCDLITVAFATLYALCSYVMAYYWCIMWIDAVALLPLCILGLNRLIDDGRAVMYVVSLALVVFSNYYMAIMVCIFIMFYYPVLYFIKVRGGGVKKCAATTGKAVGYSLLGVVMAAVMLLPTYISMQSTYYISSQMPDKWEIYNDALDVINQLLPYTELTFREGLPNLYCGMIVVILLVLYALDQKVTLREKALNGVFMLFMFFSLNTNKLDFLWHGLHFPNQLPFRYTFVICFLLIGIAYKTFLDIDRFSIKHLWTILAAGTGYYLAAQKLMAKQEYDLDLFLYGGIAWLIIYCGVMILHRKGYFLKQTFPVLIAIIIAAEMAAGACISFKEIGNSYREGYFANSKDIIKLAEKTNEEFSRTEMDYLYTLNSPAMYHYRGMSQFSSSINADTTYLMEKIGLDGSPGRNRFNYNQTAPPVNAMLNIKYLISKNEEIKDPDFKKVDTSGYSGLY
ncbi:MAG: YfhO family protein, partial [Firmicutes bacterium]|nr:YfhO family protein [Bacillota bacterium]